MQSRLAKNNALKAIRTTHDDPDHEDIDEIENECSDDSGYHVPMYTQMLQMDTH